MTVPARIDAIRLLRSLDPPAWLFRHSRVVAEVAAFLALRTAERGTPIDRPLAEAAGLLHDVDKALPASDPLRAVPHGVGSARWVRAAGHADLAAAVEAHPVTRLVDGEWFERWLGTARPEELIVAYADRRSQQRVVSLDERFASWARRYPGGWRAAEARDVRRRADRLEATVCEAAGIRPDDVRRLRWTAAAFAAIGAPR